jgi:hypothetical protein
MRLVLWLFINNWTKHKHLPLHSSSLGKSHTAGDVISTPGSSPGSLHVEVPSAGLSRPFGCCPQFQNDDLWGGIWVPGKGRSLTDSDQPSMGASESLKDPFWSKLRSRRWQCDRKRSRDATSECPHAQFLGQNVNGLVIQIQQTTDHCDCQKSIRPHESPHFGHIYLPFLTCKVFQNEVRLSQPHGHLKCFLPPVRSIKHALRKPILISSKFLLRFYYVRRRKIWSRNAALDFVCAFS